MFGLTGYVLKDENEEHFDVRMSHLYTAEMLQQARIQQLVCRCKCPRSSVPVCIRPVVCQTLSVSYYTSAAPTYAMTWQARMEYLLHGNVTDKAVSYVTPKNLMAKAYTFRKSRMLPLNMPLQSVIVRMIRCKLYVPDVSWIAGASGPYNFPRAEALWYATIALR